MFLATEINHFKELCNNNDVNHLASSFKSYNLNKKSAGKLANCITLSPKLKQSSMEIILAHCKDMGIYISPQIKSVAMRRNENLSLDFLLEQEKDFVYHALINPIVPGEIPASRAKEKGRPYYFLLKNKNITKDNSFGLIENDLNAATYHASGPGISKEEYIKYMDVFFGLNNKGENRIQQTSQTVLFSSPYLKDYLNHSSLNLSDFILQFDEQPSHKTLCDIVDSDSITTEDIVSLITDNRIMNNANETISFILETLLLSRYSLDENQAKECLEVFTTNISNSSLKDISNLFGLHTYLTILNIDYGNYNDKTFSVWASQLENKTSLNQDLFTPEKESGVFTSSGDEIKTLINEINNINPNNNAIDIILKSSNNNYPVLSNNLTSFVLNKQIETKIIDAEQKYKKPMRLL